MTAPSETSTERPGHTGPFPDLPDPAPRFQAVSVVTPLRPVRVPLAAAKFLLVRLVPRLMKVGKLRSVYFTRWSILWSIPWNGPPQPRERPRPPYLLWEACFSAAMGPYVESFVAGIPRSIRGTWSNCVGFPGTDSVTGLTRYIQASAWPTAGWYAAYPQASVRMVQDALRLAADHEALLQSARTASPPEFVERYRAFLAHHDASEGSEPSRRTARAGADSGLPVERRGPRLLTVLTPVLPVAEDRLRAALSGIALPGSPFEAVRTMHYAHFVVMGPDAGRVSSMLPLRPPLVGRYLLFTTAFDGRRAAFLEDLRTRCGRAADDIWGCCVGYPGSGSAEAFRAYLRRNQVRIHQRHLGIRATVGQVHHALEVRRRHSELARRTQGMPDDDLLAEFTAEFGVTR